MPATIVGMREWQDISVSARFRLPSVDAGACVGTRVDWVVSVGVVLCVGGTGSWNLTYGGGGPLAAAAIVSGQLPAAMVPAPGSWHTLNLTTLEGSASATFDGGTSSTGHVLFTGQPIRDIDTGFAVMSTTVSK